MHNSKKYLLFTSLVIFFLLSPPKVFADSVVKYASLLEQKDICWTNSEKILGAPDGLTGDCTTQNSSQQNLIVGFPELNIPTNSTVNRVIFYITLKGNSGKRAYLSNNNYPGFSCIGDNGQEGDSPAYTPSYTDTLSTQKVTITRIGNCVLLAPYYLNGPVRFRTTQTYSGTPGTTQIDAIAIQVDYTSPTPTPTPTVDFKQTDPQWSTTPDMPENPQTHLDHSLSCGDMYGFGCAVTSIADVFYSYGKTLLNNNSTQLNPGSLNDWLHGNNGFSSCSVIWGNVSASTKLGAPTIIFRNGNIDWNRGKQAIDTALNEGNLPILGLYTSFGTHFIPISNKLPDINGKPDYKIIDPALYPFVLNSLGNTGKPLSQTYGGFDNVFEVIIYKKASTSQKTLTIRGHSPIQLLITDPTGTQTGYVESTGYINENISESSYGTEPGIAPVDGQSQASGETKYYQQINPSDGNYKVEVIGTGDGSYSLDFSKTDEQGNVSTQIVKGFAQEGVTEIYNIQYTSDATQVPVINKEVTFEILESDIRGLYKQGQIRNESVYKTLLIQAESAEEASKVDKPIGNYLAIILLNTFQLELDHQRGKNVTEDAYQILNSDADSLIKSLQD